MDLTKLPDRVSQALASVRCNPQTAALLVIVCVFVVAGLTSARRHASHESYESLFDDQVISQHDRARIEAALGKANLFDYKLQPGRIHVPAADRARYLAAVQEANCLPQSFNGPTQQALSGASLIEPMRRSSERLHHALEQEARLAIRAIPGVHDAFVFIDEKKERSFQNQNRATAVVGIQTELHRPLDLRSFRMIQEMLLGFKAGLTIQDITITDLNARQSFRGPIAAADSPEMQDFVRQGLEREWSEKLSQSLAFVPQARIRVLVKPNQNGTSADSVRVFVRVGSDYVRRIQALSAAEPIAPESLEQIGDDIRSAILPMLPESSLSAEESVLVSVYESAEPALAATGQPLVRTSALLMSVLVVALIGSLGLLLLPGIRTRGDHGPDSKTHLRLYESESKGAESPDATSESSDAAATLRAHARDDPEAVAKSLSEFIDRAS